MFTTPYYSSVTCLAVTVNVFDMNTSFFSLIPFYFESSVFTVAWKSTTNCTEIHQSQSFTVSALRKTPNHSNLSAESLLVQL